MSENPDDVGPGLPGDLQFGPDPRGRPSQFQQQRHPERGRRARPVQRQRLDQGCIALLLSSCCQACGQQSHQFGPDGYPFARRRVVAVELDRPLPGLDGQRPRHLAHRARCPPSGWFLAAVEHRAPVGDDAVNGRESAPHGSLLAGVFESGGIQVIVVAVGYTASVAVVW
jgi:hypothetical protein